MMKQRSMRWAMHIAQMEDKRNAHRLIRRKLERKEHCEVQYVGGG
jgi:hypothetical protein